MNSTSEMDILRAEAEEEKQKLMSEMLSAAEQYAQKIDTMEKSHQQQIKSFNEQQTAEIKVHSNNKKTL